MVWFTMMLLTDTISPRKKKEKTCIQVVIQNIHKMFQRIPRARPDLSRNFNDKSIHMFVVLLTDKQKQTNQQRWKT